MLRHVPHMGLAFDGDCTQGNGIDLPVVAINLARRTDKWQTLCHRMAAVGFTRLIRAPAVEGAKLPASQVAPLLRSAADATSDGPRSHLTLTPPAIGCFLSHLAVWRWMLGAGLPRLLVLEDDAQPVASFSVGRLREVLAAPEPGLVLLGCRVMAGLAEPPGCAGKQGAELARVYYFNGTHAYLITPKVCQTMLRLLLPLHAQLDHQISSVLMQQRHVLPAYYAAPPLFDCDWSFGSDLYIPAHHLSDESAADRELGEILRSSRRVLLAEGRSLLKERSA
jgi:GR25 family glycosyltransferase involved in LPS biosynthesis